MLITLLMDNVPAASFSLDVSVFMSYAGDMFQSLMSVAAIGVGLSLGIAIITLLVRMIKSSVSNL